MHTHQNPGLHCNEPNSVQHDLNSLTLDDTMGTWGLLSLPSFISGTESLELYSLCSLKSL